MSIKVGDLVMVVKPTLCCGHTTQMQGTVFRVSGLEEGGADWKCKYCCQLGCGTNALGGKSRVEVLRLKRIPPLSELEGARDALSERHPTKEKA